MFKIKYIFDMKSLENKGSINDNNIKIFENKEQNSKTELKKNENKKFKKRKRKRKSKNSIKSSIIILIYFQKNQKFKIN